MVVKSKPRYIIIRQELQESITMLSQELMEVTTMKTDLEEDIEQKETLIENLLKNELVKQQSSL